MKQLILIRGIPGSGKSTLAYSLLLSLKESGEDCAHFEADMFFVDEKTQEYKFDASKLRQAHQWCQSNTDACLWLNMTVVVSNTFTTIKELEPYFDLAAKHDIVPVVYLAQNNFKNVHGVPDDKLQQMRDRFIYNINPLFQKYEMI